MALTHAVPADQPHSVHQLTHRLFNAYTVDGGHVYLAGCTLSDRIFGRLEFRVGDRLFDLMVDGTGAEVPAELCESLGLVNLDPLVRPPRPFDVELSRMIEGAERIAANLTAGDSRLVLEQATLIWGKFAQGTLRFEIGPQAVDLKFSGWTRTLEPPPYHCPYCDVETFHLAATDDGRIVAANEIRQCEETGRRILSEELIPCAVSGRRIVSELIEVCPVTGQRAFGALMATCPTCRQRVSPGALSGGECLACRNLQEVASSDPRLARLLFEHPQLDRWRHWRMAETATVYILVGSRWLRRLLVVLDRESLEMKIVAAGHRLFGAWEFAKPEQFRLMISE